MVVPHHHISMHPGQVPLSILTHAEAASEVHASCLLSNLSSHLGDNSAVRKPVYTHGEGSA